MQGRKHKKVRASCGRPPVMITDISANIQIPFKSYQGTSLTRNKMAMPKRAVKDRSYNCLDMWLEIWAWDG